MHHCLLGKSWIYQANLNLNKAIPDLDHFLLPAEARAVAISIGTTGMTLLP